MSSLCHVLNATKSRNMLNNYIFHNSFFGVLMFNRYWVNRDALFSHHSLSETFLQRIMSMYTAAHYKNSPNDLQMLSDAPAHELYVLLGPTATSSSGGRLPDVLCVVQVAFEGRISKQTLSDNTARGRSAAGDLIPWSLSMQFGDDGFATLCGARVVRIATHPDVQKMGYGSRAMQLLLMHFKGELLGLDESDEEDDDDDDDDEDEDHEGLGKDLDEEREVVDESSNLLDEEIRPRSKLPPLLVPLASRRPPLLHWCGVSFGVTQPLLKFWVRLGFELTYLRQTKNDVTGEHTSIMLCDISSSALVSSSVSPASLPVDDGPRPVDGWLGAFVWDARRRLVSLLAFTFHDFSTAMALELLSNDASLAKNVQGLSAGDLELFMTSHDLKRLDMYSRNMVDYHLITDILPTLARLFFLGHLSIAPEGGSDGARIDLTLSMVQKAILVGVGLQHRSVDSIAAELKLPASQVLALFNKAVRKINSYLKNLVEKDTEQSIMGSAKKRGLMSRLAYTAESMSATANTLHEDLEDGAGEALTKLQRQQGSTNTATATHSTATAAALLAQDDELMAYSVRGTDEEWAKALQNSGDGDINSIAVKAKREVSNGMSSTDVECILEEAQEERAAQLSEKKKKKRARILGGGFNENATKGDGAASSSKKKKRKKQGGGRD